MSSDSPYPSRRSLREQGLTTGSTPTITDTDSVPPQPGESSQPLTRRERRERERLAETGALPSPLPVATPPEEPAPDDRPTGSAETASSSDPEVSEAPSPMVVPPVDSPPAATRALTRRERREMERRGEPVPETGMIPVAADVSVTARPESAGETTAPGSGRGEQIFDPQPVAEEVFGDKPVIRSESSVRQAETPAVSPENTPPVVTSAEVSRPLPAELSEPATDSPQTAEPEPAALPPVFAPTPSPEVHTASSREVSVASDQTNALILPVAPAMDLTGPIGDTGEVLVTGNIPLPKQVSEQAITGIVEVDSDEYDVTDTGTFSSPIRATHAVSSRSLELAQPMIRKPRWGATSIVLAFSSAVLAVAAVGLLTLALMTDLIALPLP